ncbi:gamma-aminobutyric acid receptor subunit beta-like [Oppia nitens]|uniref:gamma-aminobutyric acid receptor subunit beta-like n=1 Tax=Oppia nitens TaxID=1686743 RepID=UPI0023D9E119|nr:gamma-aminobutyric acid receptor subunit beta-like [Oppia nitens]
MYIISISSISAVNMDFTADFYFRQSWRDSRLSFMKRPGIDALFVGAEVSDKIWVPDTFFANEKSYQFHMATTENTFIRIKSNGEVLRSIRLTITSSCPMNLQYFPMDRQKCTIEVESYGYSMSDIQYKWGMGDCGESCNELAVGMSSSLELPQFKVKGHNQKKKIEFLSTGNYSRLVCEIEFVRSMGYYLIQIYIPASLIVIISWVSFWLHRNASPARVQLGVTTVLTMTTLMSSTNAAMPKISYIKSIDVFLGTCFVMVFAALLEYATVGYMGKRIAMRKSRSQQLAKYLAEHRQKCIAASIDSGLEPPIRTSLYTNPCIPAPKGVTHVPEVRYRISGGSRTLTRTPSYKANKQMQAQDGDLELSGADAEAVTPSTPTQLTPFRGPKNPNTLFGVCPSDIDKYSRVVFPVCFLCFNLMYWIIYMHISDFLLEESSGDKEGAT